MTSFRLAAGKSTAYKASGACDQRDMKNRNFNEWGVALAVIACSVVLFLALAFALSGTMISRPDRVVKANFPDITGISIGSKVKFAGANAGKVSGIRVLTLEERAKDPNPLNAVQITLALEDNLSLPSDTTVSVSADTLLSDKFVLLSGGTASSPPLGPDVVLQGIPPTPFDQLARDIDGVIGGLNGLLGGNTKGDTRDIFDRLRALLSDTQGLITEAKPAVDDIRQLTSDAKQLISENKTQISDSIVSLNKTATAFEQLAKNGNDLIVNNENKLNGTIADLKVTSENLKVTSTYTKMLVRSLSQKPSQLLWGNSKPPTLPSEQQILRSTKPIPAQ